LSGGEDVEAGAVCKQVLKQYGSVGEARKLARLVSLTSVTSGDAQPYAGDPAWGRRLGFVAIDLFSPKTGSKVACAVVAKEGAALEGNPCEQYADASGLSDAERKNANKTHIEQSLFGTAERLPDQAQCKSGESAAEVDGCR
jgi:hypothetical protein